MEAVQVVARFELDGVWTPLSFSWKGQIYTVDSVGRRWQDTRGQHALVMTPVDRAFELIYVTDKTRWYLISPGPKRV